MDRKTLIDLLQTPDKVASDMGYRIDWSTNESVRESIAQMDIISSAIVKSCIEITASALEGISKEELEQAGITPENLLRVAGGFTTDA